MAGAGGFYAEELVFEDGGLFGVDAQGLGGGEVEVGGGFWRQVFGGGGYRVELFSKANAAGKKITFTGSLSNGPSMVDGVTFPKNNEGHSGWKIDQLLRAMLVGLLADAKSLAEVEDLTAEMSSAMRKMLKIPRRLPDTTLRDWLCGMSIDALRGVLHQLSAVAEAAIIGIPSEQWGEVGMAIVAVKPGHSLTPAEIHAHCAANLAKFKCPRMVEFVDALPRNATGKIHKPTLRKQFNVNKPTDASAAAS